MSGLISKIGSLLIVFILVGCGATQTYSIYVVYNSGVFKQTKETNDNNGTTNDKP